MVNITSLLAASVITILDFQNHALEDSFSLGLYNNPIVGNVQTGAPAQQVNLI